MTPAPDPAVMQALVDNHRRFLDFLEPRTGSRAGAEDLLQSAFVRALEKGDGLPARESAVAWFYRTLRRALIDRHRARSAAGHALVARAREEDPADEVEDPALRAEVCRCVLDLLPTIRPVYAAILKRVDLEQEAVQHAAEAIGITPNNAAVRLHRARKALRWAR
jgi:RNA polymerase sigma factor (sigma-70 family)